MQQKKRRRRARAALTFLGGAALAYVGGSYLFARRLADRLISAEGLAPNTARRDELLAALRLAAPLVADYRHAGSARSPASLAAVFASPGEPERRATILFLHGKGGSSAEWQPDALRGLSLGYNALLPDLRGHRPSEGNFVTYGLLEKDDLANAIRAASERFGLDPGRLGIHACSAGCIVALEFSAGRSSVRALWLESPYADPLEMARHYLSVATRAPRWLLRMTSRWAVSRAVARVRREIHTTDPEGGLERIDPVHALSRVKAPVCLVHGDRDRLVPPLLAARLGSSLPAGSRVWNVDGAGHCHHEDEAARVVKEEYEKRWTDFFSSNLPPQTSKS